MAPNPVGAVLARDKGTSVGQTQRVIVHREQARLIQGSALFQLKRVIVLRGQASLQQRSPNLYEVQEWHRTLWERCLVWDAFGRSRR